MKDIIQVAYGEFQTAFDDEVMKAVQQVGIYVNKEELLKALELADKLVHCEDCKWFDNEDYGEPTRFCKLHESIIKQNDFCSYGERKEE